MKLAIFLPKSELDRQLRNRLSKLGVISYTDSRRAYTQNELDTHARGAQIVALDPDNFGGFEKASDRVSAMLKTNPQIQGIALLTTSYGWIDLDFCKKQGIVITNVPGYSREAVAEHTLGLLLSLAKKIIETDRKSRENRYTLDMGFELASKTLGIIGLGNIGSRVAELGIAIGMKVIAYNLSHRKQKGVEMVTLHELFKRSNAISLHFRNDMKTRNFIHQETINQMKPGVIVVNTVGREVVDETDMARALNKGQVSGYAYEGENLTDTPLANLDNAIGLKGFGWYTREALSNLYRIGVENIESLVNLSPQNIVS